MSNFESIDLESYLYDLERIQCDVLSDPIKTYHEFCKLVEADPEWWEARAEMYAEQFDEMEADMRLQQDFVDELVQQRGLKRQDEISVFNSMLDMSPEVIELVEGLNDNETQSHGMDIGV